MKTRLTIASILSLALLGAAAGASAADGTIRFTGTI